MSQRVERQRVEVTSRAEWRGWLEKHAGQKASIWLVTYKKVDAERHVPYADVVEEALCFGWVDSLPRRLDDRRSMLLLSPRKPGSAWSRPNKERAERMIAQGLMTPAGQIKIDAAKADGSWIKLDKVEDLVVPEDLSAAFERHPSASKQFASFPRSVKRGILEWIEQAKKPETRRARVEKTAAMAAQGERANQYR